MGKCSQTFREIRFLIEDELTHCYVLIEADGDCPMGVQGWHHKVFPKSKPIFDLGKEVADAVMWGQEAPPK